MWRKYNAINEQNFETLTELLQLVSNSYLYQK